MGRNKLVGKSTSPLKRDGFLLTQVVPLCFCLRCRVCEEGLGRDEGAGVEVPAVAGLDQTGAQRKASAAGGGLPWARGYWPEALALALSGEWT